MIVTKDSDFPERVLIEGGPPKILWLQLGNCSTTEIEMLLRDAHREISEMGPSDKTVLLAVP